MTPWTRIAPTPSGLLHAGNAVNFLLTAAIAERVGARLRLRIDDLDAERMRPAFVDDIFASLRWLGVAWHDGPRDRHDHERRFSQHLRITRYQEALDVLKEQGDLYACGCSRADLKRGACACRMKSLDFRAPESAWRLRLPADGLVRLLPLFGTERWLSPGMHMVDPVLRQRGELGGRPAYQIASLVDDVDQGVTHIVRGVDLLPSTLCQLHLAERLGLDAFLRVRFVHHPLIADANGAKLSKSEGAEALKSMREAGRSPDALRDKAQRMLRDLEAEGDQIPTP